MTATNKLGLELLQNAAANQTLANTTFAHLNQLVQAGVADKDLAAPPDSPADESLYIVASSATDAWAGRDGQLAYWLVAAGAWQFVVPKEGFLLHVNDEDVFYKYTGTAWEVFSGGGSGGGMTNPMTAIRDMIVGGVGGSPTRLAGPTSEGMVLTRIGNALAWAIATGFANPMTTVGDLIVGGAAGAASRLGIGAAGQVLTVVSGALAWVTPSGGGGGGTGDFKKDGSVTMTGPVNEAPITRLYSQNPVNLGATTSNVVNFVYWDISVASFGTAPIGIRRTLIRTGSSDASDPSLNGDTGPITLVHSGSLRLPGSADIIMVIGDSAEFESLGGGKWNCNWFKKGDGTPLVTPSDPNKVDKAAGLQLSQESYTTVEKAKLAGLDPNHFRGMFATLAALQAAVPTANIGDYAFVDPASGSDVVQYLWDNNDSKWVYNGPTAGVTAAQVKTLYESNANTNAYTDAEKSKLAGVAAGAQVNVATNLAVTTSATTATVTSSTGTSAVIPTATSSIAGTLSAADKAKLDGVSVGAQVNAVTSVASRTGAVVLAKADVGLANADNTADSVKPVSTPQQAALNLKANLSGADFTGAVSMLGTTSFTASGIAIDRASGGPTITFSGPPGTHRQFIWQTAGSNRFRLSADSTAEGGSNSGSNLALASYTDAGVFLGAPLLINRATSETQVVRLNSTGPVSLGQYTLTTIPSPSTYNGYYVTITNATGGPKLCYLNGTNCVIANTSTIVS